MSRRKLSASLLLSLLAAVVRGQRDGDVSNASSLAATLTPTLPTLQVPTSLVTASSLPAPSGPAASSVLASTFNDGRPTSTFVEPLVPVLSSPTLASPAPPTLVVDTRPPPTATEAAVTVSSSTPTLRSSRPSSTSSTSSIGSRSSSSSSSTRTSTGRGASSATRASVSPSPSSDALSTSSDAFSTSSDEPSTSSDEPSSSAPTAPGASSPTEAASAESAAPRPSNGGRDGRRHRNVVVILSTVLGSLALILLLCLALVLRRLARRKPAFAKRTSTPIDDDEIETWRASNQSALTAVSANYRPSREPAWMAEAKSEKSADSAEIYTDTPAIARAPASPPILVNIARAPNSRSGLTDSTIPGADPFVTPLRRHSSRLQKAPPARLRSSHSRHSRHSSISGMSARPMTPTSPPPEEVHHDKPLSRPLGEGRPISGSMHFHFDFDKPSEERLA
ncbi:MAG: hypothetical protein M1832_000670 [Thelocarpon impressellum]|nr:MAG: hypothetical protein M1832_000670 [Thelocarpon impressellum]